MHLSGVWTRVLDVVYPRWCEGCGLPVAGSDVGHICWECARAFRPIEFPYCDVCGDPCDGELSGIYTCTFCRKHPPAFDMARSAVRYRGSVQQVIQGYKYRQAVHLTPDLGMYLEACYRSSMKATPIDAVVAVPLHPVRERERTYNQADLLARWLAVRMGWSWGHGCLVRTRPTESQTTHSADERRRNVRGAFATRQDAWIEGRRILLIDDVMTTGATLHECAKALKEAGAVSVAAMTVARG